MIYIQPFCLPKQCTGKERYKREHEAGQRLLKDSLKLEFGLEIPNLLSLIRKEERGKPYLEGYPDIFFNISHSQGMAVCALGNQPLGVDVEKIRPANLSIIRKCLTKKEQNYLKSLREENRNQDFFRFWTLKESYAKAVGIGLSLDFSSIEFELEPFAAHLNPSEKNWQFLQTLWKEGEEAYVISFCGLQLPESPCFLRQYSCKI
ncbi:MAG: 4'-phosphopantetheinyl transferase superfamily protein [Lachnospiraceae bacterium]|jgi:4'-phosphopantetheinyl transferase|nr:4'-phosphopantetheinyl transferase superfamily protein [Lachnospiraceae bacterium]